MRADLVQDGRQPFTRIIDQYVDPGNTEKRFAVFTGAHQVHMGERGYPGQGFLQQSLTFAGLYAAHDDQPETLVQPRPCLHRPGIFQRWKRVRNDPDIDFIPACIQPGLQIGDRSAGRGYCDRVLLERRKIGVANVVPGTRAAVVKLAVVPGLRQGALEVGSPVRADVRFRMNAQQGPGREKVVQHLDGRQTGPQRVQAVTDQRRNH